jgi:hypothetical protein
MGASGSLAESVAPSSKVVITRISAWTPGVLGRTYSPLPEGEGYSCNVFAGVGKAGVAGTGRPSSSKAAT